MDRENCTCRGQHMLVRVAQQIVTHAVWREVGV
jgi:hypothetical protein